MKKQKKKKLILINACARYNVLVVPNDFFPFSGVENINCGGGEGEVMSIKKKGVYEFISLLPLNCISYLNVNLLVPRFSSLIL